MALSEAIPEPMNASPHHSKVKVTTTMADPIFVAGTYVSGKVEMECRADKGLGIGIMMVELFAVQELSSRDHSATSTFIHSRRLFQGPGLPPSNAVQAHPMPGDPHLPQHYFGARRGRSTFLFRIPLPETSPCSILYGSGLAKVRYELRASVGVFWKNEKRLVVDKHPVNVVEAFPYEEAYLSKAPEGIVVGESGKLWMHGRMVGSVVVAGGSACLELQVKNHSGRKNTGLTLSVTRTLYLPAASTGNHQQPAPVQISDVLTTVPYRGPEYIIPPGAEGVANLVFDVPKHARGVRGGTLDGEEIEEGKGARRHSESLFEIRCKVEVKLSMGMGSRDIVLEVPIEIVHPRAMPLPDLNEYPAPYAHAELQPQHTAPYPDYNDPYYRMQASSPAPGVAVNMPYVDPNHNQVWLPPPQGVPPQQGYQYLPPEAFQLPMAPYAMQHTGQGYYGSNTPPLLAHDSQHPSPVMFSPVGVRTPGPPPSAYQMHSPIQRPLSAGPVVVASQVPQPIASGLPMNSSQVNNLLHPPQGLPVQMHDLSHTSHHLVGMQHPVGADSSPQQPHQVSEPEEGKGERALRVSRHLRMSSRNRSVSPQSHRYPLALGVPTTVQEAQVPNVPSDHIAVISGISSARPISRMLPVPPGVSTAAPLLLPQANISVSPPQEGTAVVYSPRPQLTPKHSFTRDHVLGVVSKSERVEELEKMADAVDRKSRDLSADLPRGILGLFAGGPGSNGKEDPTSKVDADVNKTLPGPSVPSVKDFISPTSGRARADLYFASTAATASTSEVTSPLPANHQTPPTPALLAVLPTRPNANREVLAESGLDALEKRLLAEVGTRNFDPWRATSGKGKDSRPDVRSVLPPVIDTVHLESAPYENVNGRRRKVSDQSSVPEPSVPIPIPMKSPEPLNDSAISSLTLAGGLGGDESDGDADGRTHRAGKSRNGSGDEREAEGLANGHATVGMAGSGTAGLLHMHMRQRAEVSTPTKTLKAEREIAEMESEKSKEKDKSSSKEGMTSGRKKDKSAAKGRVAAWLGRIDPDVPPQEQIIPPSPSVVRPPDADFTSNLEDEQYPYSSPPQHDGTIASYASPVTGDSEPQKDVSASPNPRSSGFVPIATLNRSTIITRPLVARDATVVEETRRVQDIWSSNNPQSSVVQAVPAAPRFPVAIPLTAAPQSIRTDRRVSPPSRPAPSKPLSYSAAARNVWKHADQNSKVLPPTPAAVFERGSSNNGNRTPAPPAKLPTAGRLPSFPAPRPADPEVKYDIRSARGGRGGKVTSVANLWASGAITSNQKDRDAPKRLSVVEEAKPTLAPKPATKPAPPDKKLFSAAVKTPPRSTPRPAAAAPVGAASTPYGLQRRPDSRNLFSAESLGPKKSISSTTAHPGVKYSGNRSTEALVQNRPLSAMANSRTPFSQQGKTSPTNLNLSTPAALITSDPKLHRLAAKGVRPVIKATSDPAVVSSSHAVPHLSSTASLARPHPVSARKATSNSPASSNSSSRPIVKLPTNPAGPSLASTLPAESGRPASPSKPVDLAFGQARLRDLIKKYQGQGQKT